MSACRPRSIAVIALASMLLCQMGVYAQDRTQVIDTTSITFPPHTNDPARHLIAIDPFKMWGMLHAFFAYGITDRLAVGGAIHTPTGALLNASGIGIQPEITFNLRGDPFNGPYIGATGWFNYLTYNPEETEVTTMALTL